MRSTSLFNHGWLYYPERVGTDKPDSTFTSVTLPHTNVELPYHNFHDAEYQFISTYRKRFALPESLDGRRLFIDFDGAMLAAQVNINGHDFREHRGGYTPFSVDITDFVDEAGENTLTVHLDSRERQDIPPFGYVVDYLTFGGIYRDVHLRYVAPVFIQNAHVRTHDILSDTPAVEVVAYVQNTTDQTQTYDVMIESDGLHIAETAQSIEIAPGERKPVTIRAATDNARRWTLAEPTLYSLTVKLCDDQLAVDEYPVQFGFRDAAFRDDGFYLNGERVQLRGLNRHQTFPYIGAAAPERLQRKDADIIKFELGCNIVRTSHYPQSPHFLRRCDEIGLLVFEEIPGWQHIGDEDWKQLSLRDVRAMIERDWNHPSIVLWGVRINESQDDDDFYRRTNALAHELDPTRQTGGVRNFHPSEFLEDVFTYNDFSNDVIEPPNTPYMITEFNGHMFPTKTFDNEERRLEHALRHARIQSKAATMGGVSGAIGWCAFDYNTHKEFGSGDRICYHGVMDIFRLPKYAAYFYESQIPPSERVVLRAATLWSMGDRSAGGNDPLIIFSNCERVDVFAGAEQVGQLTPDYEHYPNLPHPPFILRGLRMRWGSEFGDLRVVGYIGDDVVAEQIIECDAQPHRLIFAADDDELRADGMDMTRLVLKIVDRHGNPLPYVTRVISLELVSGEAELIGENPFPLVGGQASLYLKATDKPSEVTVRAATTRLQPVELTVNIR